MRQRQIFLIMVILAAAAAALLFRSRGPRLVELEGPSMGTAYHALLKAPLSVSPLELKNLFTRRLQEINDSMSTWKNDSEISKVNRAPAGEWITVSPELAHVLELAQQLGAETDGLMDVTVSPLVGLWGFGRSGKRRSPGEAEIQEALQKVGYQKFLVQGNRVKKLVPELEIDFSAFVPGYAVDQLADAAAAAGVQEYLIELGGEVRAQGNGPAGRPWTVGIEQPRGAGGQELAAAVALTSGSVATSGSYRRFAESGGVRIHHIIDPRTGRPADSDIVSATVYADRCYKADAIGTALLVMGSEKALQWLDRHEGYEAYLIKADHDVVWTKGFSKLLLPEE